MKAIILFDGICSFCDKSVHFIINRDPAKYFSFAALQSDVGKRLITEYGISKDNDSLLLIEQGICYEKSFAALHIAKHLKGMWKLSYMFIVVPKPIRNLIYDQIAKHRYKWFGKKTSCRLPTSEEKERFL